MSKRQDIQLRTPRPTWHQTRYAFHEAGHAVVGHVLGRCLSEISILANREEGYKGYCAFDEFAERWQGLLQWSAESQNPERITIRYAGTVAMRLICQQRGWQYERWRRCDMEDFYYIYLWSLEMAADEEERRAIQQDCLKRAQAILEEHWSAVESLAAALLAQGRVRGLDAHRLIQQTIDPSLTDWRMDVLNHREPSSEAGPAF